MSREDAQKFLESLGYTTEVHEGVLYCVVSRKKVRRTAFTKTYRDLIDKLRSNGYTQSFGMKYGKEENEN